MGKIFYLIFTICLVSIPEGRRGFKWPWEDETEQPTAEEILEEHGHSQSEKSHSYWDQMKDWTGLDTKESEKESNYFDQFRFWEKDKEEKEAKIMKAKLLSALDVNIEEIAKQRTFMNSQVDKTSDFENMFEALDQIKYLLLPVRRFIELDNSKSPESYVDYPRVYMRRLNVLLERLYNKKDELKLQESIISTNIEFMRSPKFRFGVFYTKEEAAEIFEVINAKKEEKLEHYWKQLDKMKFNFNTKVKEINELRKETDANIQLFFSALDKVMGLMNTQKQLFFETFSDYDGDLESEKKSWIMEKMKENMKYVVDRRERVLETVNQISFVLKEMMDMKEPVGELLKDAEADVKLILISYRQFGKGDTTNPEKYFDEKEQKGREKAMRNKVVEKIRDGSKSVEDITDPDIGAAVLNQNEDDPKKEGDPYFHLRDQKEVDKEMAQREKDAENKHKNMRGNSPEEDDQVDFLF